MSVHSWALSCKVHVSVWLNLRLARSTRSISLCRGGAVLNGASTRPQKPRPRFPWAGFLIALFFDYLGPSCGCPNLGKGADRNQDKTGRSSGRLIGFPPDPAISRSSNSQTDTDTIRHAGIFRPMPANGHIPDVQSTG